VGDPAALDDRPGRELQVQGLAPHRAHPADGLVELARQEGASDGSHDGRMLAEGLEEVRAPQPAILGRDALKPGVGEEDPAVAVDEKAGGRKRVEHDSQERERGGRSRSIHA
jgi:hypothetical protein